jgi:hypothetical protein
MQPHVPIVNYVIMIENSQRPKWYRRRSYLWPGVLAVIILVPLLLAAPDARESIESSLTATGLTLVSMDPTNALMKLHRAARRNRGVPDDDLYGDDL